MILVALSLLAPSALANNAGKTGVSTSGCSGCHTGGTAPTVTLAAGSATVAPGASTTITFSVLHLGASQTAGGLDVAATGGSFTAGSGTRVSGGEITHTSRLAEDSSGASSWSFTWTAPSTEGTYTINAAGNSVNANGGTSGDRGATTTMTITVDDGCDDLDRDGVTDCAGDCDDGDATVKPGASETCDGVDEDCDGTVDESATDATTYFRDADGDGAGSAASTLAACSLPSGYVATASDCDDTDAGVNPGARETCDGVDEDCDGTADDGAVDADTWYRDADADGYGSSVTTTDCTVPTGYAAVAGDCDDADARVSPAGTETCDAADRDEDCDGLADDDDTAPSGRSTFYRDVDGDGFGDGSGTLACDAPAGFVTRDGDCDDGTAGTYPGAAEACDATTDTNCDGATGTGDADGDGFAACNDCDDGDRASFPGATETCNGVDDDCDGTIDGDSEVTDGGTYYADTDGDGFGDPAVTTTACAAPAGYTSDATDCDDADPGAFPAAAEVWYDGMDQDCDGNDTDQDGDGVAATEAGGTDCDDRAAGTFPGAADAPYDGVDADCAGNDDNDADGDGFASGSHGGTDCDDSRADVYPGAPDAPYDGVVTDCDGSDENDADGDGHDARSAGGDDCDDARSDVNPDSQETWYDGVDQDCDGNDTDQDGDGATQAEDCDDTDPAQAEDCGGGDTGDTGTADTGGSDDGDDDEKDDDDDDGCGCASSGAPAGGAGLWAGVLAMVAGALRARRRG